MKMLLIDDHRLYLEGIRAILDQLFPLSHIIATNKVKNALDEIKQHDDIDIILLDLRMPDGGAPAVFNWLQEQNVAIPVLVVSASENSVDVKMATNLGALGYLPKSSSSATLKLAIETILMGKEFLPDGWHDSLNHSKNITSKDGGETISISPRLYEVLQLIEKGCSTLEISNFLDLSEHTVKGYIKELFSRFEVHSRTELIQSARQLHFFSLGMQ